jgi:hypothetical protein
VGHGIPHFSPNQWPYLTSHSSTLFGGWIGAVGMGFVHFKKK